MSLFILLRFLLSVRVKIHSLQERNVLIVDRHVKKKKGIYNNYSPQVEVASRENLQSCEGVSLISTTSHQH